MATLTETAYYARKGVNIAFIALVVIIVGRMLIFGAIGLKERFFPTPPPPANNALGALPFPNFVGSEASPSGVTYTLETVDGGLPTMPRTVTVYALTPDSRVSFGTFDRMKAFAADLGFTGEPQKKEGSYYEFQDPKDPLRTLLIDELSGDFEINYNFGSNLDVFKTRNFTSNDELITKTKDFFEDLGLLTPDLATGSAEISYMKLDGQNLVPTTSLANSDAVYVSLKRGDLDGSPVVSPNAKKGLVSALIVGNSTNDGILETTYYHSTVDPTATGTYDPISSSDAFEKLKKGDAIFASLPSPMLNSVPIRSVSFAYLDPFPPQGFLQPVIVFTDDKDFKAYVPAVKY